MQKGTKSLISQVDGLQVQCLKQREEMLKFRDRMVELKMKHTGKSEPIVPCSF